MIARVTPLQKGIALQIGAELAFALLWVFTKALGTDFPPNQIVLVRSVVALILILGILQKNNGMAQLKTTRPAGHFLRSFLGVASIFCASYAVPRLPLAEASAILKTVPVICCLLGFIFLHEKITRSIWIAIALGLCGALLIIQPQNNIALGPALIMMLQSVLYAGSLVTIRQLAKTENTLAIVFYYNISCLIVSLITSVFFFHLPNAIECLLFLGIGLSSALAQILVTRSYKHAEVNKLAPYGYTGIFWTTLFGFLIWSDFPNGLSWLGMLIIVITGLVLWHIETRKSVRPS